jgi:TRAP-type C4-dicarboxylate transport system permease small subunit
VLPPARRVFRSFGRWTLAQLSFAWACVLGADLALKKNTHIEIDILIRKFPRQVRKVLAVIWLMAIAAFLCFLVWYGTKLTLQNMERVLGDVGISYSWVTGCIPVGALLMLGTAVTPFVARFDRARGAFTRRS